MSVKKTVIGMGFTFAMFTQAAFGGAPQVFLSIVDTVLYPGDPNGRNLTIRLQNPVVKVGGFRIGLAISDPSIINFTYYDVDTTLPYWQYYNCNPPPCDSVLQCRDTCFIYYSTVVTQNTRSENFDYMQGRRLSEVVWQVTGIVQQGSGPVLQPGNGVLFRVPLEIFPISDTVPLSQRRVPLSFDPVFTHVTDSTGNILWRVSDNTLSLTNGTVTVPFSVKGDNNFDGKHSAVDAVILLGWVFSGSPQPLPSPSVGDVNCDGRWTGSDIVLLLTKIFGGVPFPC